MSWGDVVASQLGEPGVSEARMFGSDCLKVGAKVFAVAYKGDLVLKLPSDRVAELKDAGTGVDFVPMSDRVMREWVQVPPSDAWPALAGEARRFVAP